MTDKNGNWEPPMTRDENELIKLPLIPDSRIRLVANMIPEFTEGDRGKIRVILNMGFRRAFMRCKGKNQVFIDKREAAGDFSHSDKKHWCTDCGCRHAAGEGTKGDFYGLGPQTGHFGVGFCKWCQGRRRGRGGSIRPTISLRIARQQVELLQTYGTMSVDKDYELKVEKAEQQLARQTIKARQEVELVVTELEKFQNLPKDHNDPKWPKTYVLGMLVPASDMEVFKAKLEVAKILSRLRVDGLRIDKDHYIHVDELTTRMPEMLNLFSRCVSKLIEMVVAKQVRGEEVETDMPPDEYVTQLFREGMKNLWGNVKPGARK